MDINRVNALLPGDSLFRGRILLQDCVDSTNTVLRELATRGAAQGTTLLAEEQTSGRGTQGRTFYSEREKGLYLSLLLQPEASLPHLLTLTGRIAVAVRDGIQAACGAPVRIKWLNDIWLEGRKVCGILTELGEGFVVVGIGVNVSQTPSDFQKQGLDEIALSLAQAGYPVSREMLAASILTAVGEMYQKFPGGLEDSLCRYRTHCITMGKAVSFPSEGTTRTGTALDVDGGFSLLVRDPSGTVHTVSAGTVTLL